MNDNNINIIGEYNINDNVKTDILLPTSTDMLVNFIANSDKLIEEDKRWNYDKGDIKNNNIDDNELDDNQVSYLSDSNKKLFKQEYKNLNNDIGTVTNNEIEHKPFININDKNKTLFKQGPGPINNDNRSVTNNETENKPFINSKDSNNSKNETTEEDENQLVLDKLDMLRKLGELTTQCGVKLSRDYDMNSSLKMMEYEYKLHSDIRAKQNSVEWMSHMLVGCVKGLEMFNDNYNPFDIKLSGLGTKVSSDINNYYIVLGEIYEKYNKPGKQMAPEMKLILMLLGATFSVQVNKVMSDTIPGIANLVKNNDSVINNLRQKAADSTTKKPNIFNVEHDNATQKANDLHMIKEKELEYQRMKKLMDDKNGTLQNIKNDMILSADSPSDSNIHSEKYINNNLKSSLLNENTNNNNIMHEIPYSNNVYSKQNDIKKNSLLESNKKLDDILNELNDNSLIKNKTKKEHDAISITSDKSSISINPNIEKIMNPNSNITKQLNTVNKKKNIIDIKPEDISFGSSNDNNKKTSTNYHDISFGSKKKGNSVKLKVGK